MKRIITIATSTTGGAGVSATNLVEGLKGAELEFVVISRENVDIVLGTSKFTAFWKSRVSKLVTYFNHLISSRRYGFVSPNSFGYLSYRSILKLKPDEVHIHNWYNLISLRTLRRLIENQSVVITAHDARILSGGCHVLLECNNFRSGCQNCPAMRIGKHRAIKSWRKLRKALSKPHNLTIVSPSHWLEKELRNALPSKNNLEILRIENVISKDYFTTVEYFPKKEIRKILFISADLTSVFKGGNVLIDAMKLVAESTPLKNWEVTMVGHGELISTEVGNLFIRKVPTSTQAELISLYQSSDLLVIPSSFDNFPTVAIEAQLCGLPVLGTRVGGIPEILQEGQTGFLCEFNMNSIAERILLMTIDDLNKVGSNALKMAKIRFGDSRILTEYERVLK